MVIESMQLQWIGGLVRLLLFLLGVVMFYKLLLSLLQKQRRWRQWNRSFSKQKRTIPRVLLKLLFVQTGESKMDERKQLLVGAGLLLDPLLYEFGRRLLGAGCAAAGIMGYLGLKHPALVLYVQPIYVITGALVGFILVCFDRKFLEQLKQQRSHRIIKEVYALSNQLLYYTGSKMNLHTKLMRCIPHTKTVRSAFQQMLNEWYQDAEQAIRRFKLRLGTDEAHSFAETINSLRLNDHDGYYELLRQRIQDYKEKIELAKESRKETVSYLLFVLAGLPILNTFRVFMYPWVMEGQKLFHSIN